MADLRGFLSFDYDHNQEQKNLFAGQCSSKSPTPFTIADWSSKSTLPQAQWKAEIKKKINQTNMLIVLVGRSMGSATGVATEVALAKEQSVPVFGVYVDGANESSTLPTGLARGRTIAWDWKKIAAAVRQMMTEGKNAA